MAAHEGPLSSAKLEARPLYVRARAEMVQRLISGQWKPGQMLPSEFGIAEELGVSQGTVRKALHDMTVEGLLVRRQGKGTFVAEAEDKSILFRFFRLTADDGAQAQSFPSSTYLSRCRAVASDEEQAIFDIGATDEVWRFERLRSNDTGPILWERLVLPCSKFGDLDKQTLLPNNVYQFYGARYGIIVARVEEKLRAKAAPTAVADLLKLKADAPVLEIDRRAVALNGDVVEWRVSLCRSDTMHYRNELR